MLRKPITLAIEKLTVGYNGYPVIKDIDFSIKGPALLQILGPNGAGKTTLLKAVLGLLKPLYGRVIVNGSDVTGKPWRAGKYFGYVPQLFTTSTTMYPVTAWELVENTYMLYRKRWPRLFPEKNVRRRVAEVLRAVGLPRDAWYRSFWRLSGGQRQRVLIACALVHDPPILLMDEPLSAVDPAGKVEIARLIGCLKETKLVIVTSHDPMLLLDYTDHIMLINREKYRIGRPEEILVPSVMEEFYGEAVVPVKDHLHICDYHA